MTVRKTPSYYEINCKSFTKSGMEWTAFHSGKSTICFTNFCLPQRVIMGKTVEVVSLSCLFLTQMKVAWWISWDRVVLWWWNHETPGDTGFKANFDTHYLLWCGVVCISNASLASSLIDLHFSTGCNVGRVWSFFSPPACAVGWNR